MRCISSLGAIALSLGLCACAVTAPPAPPTAAAQVKALFEDYWEWVLREHPEFATTLGDHRYDDRLQDESAAAVMRRKAAASEFRERGARIDAAQLSPEDRTSLRVLQFGLDRDRAITRLYGTLPFGVFDSWAPVTQMGGIHLDLPQLVAATRFESVRDYDAYLKRLDAVPDSVAQLVARMQLAMGAGWMPPRIAVSGVPKQLEAQVDADPLKSPEYEPFKSFPMDMAPAAKEQLAAAGRRVIQEKVIPAFRSLKNFYETRYLPAAPERLAASALPAGPPYYQAWLAWNTSTDMTPRQIHDLGLGEVARIGVLMDAITVTAGFKGTRREFQKFISTDAQFLYTKPEDMLAGYRDIAKRADAELPRLFAELPRQPYGIRAMRPEEGNNAEHYTNGAQDGSRAGFFEANVNDLKTRPKWTMETLLLHEAVPGHHLQTARAQELETLPAFRRHVWFTAYGEGWALYAESLGDEMGFYKDPYQKFGNLSFEMLRAC